MEISAVLERKLGQGLQLSFSDLLGRIKTCAEPVLKELIPQLKRPERLDTKPMEHLVEKIEVVIEKVGQDTGAELRALVAHYTAFVDGLRQPAPLHFACRNGSLDLVKSICRSEGGEGFRKMLEEEDEEGKRPLHLACAGEQNANLVEYLIDAGAELDVTDNQGYTAVHWAASSGHLKSLIRLKGAGANLALKTNKGELAVLLALASQQSEVFFWFLDPVGHDKFEKVVLEHHDNDVEGTYYKALIRARKRGEELPQIACLLQITALRRQGGDVYRTALLSNAAYGLVGKLTAEQGYPLDLSSGLEPIEDLYLATVTGKAVEQASHFTVQQRRDMLKSARAMAKAVLDDQDTPVEEVVAKLSRYYREIFRGIIEEAMRRLGRPPTDYAFLCFGSMARSEMCRNSDVEWGILLREDTEKNRTYFHQLAELVRLMVINMGETSFEIGRDDTMGPGGFLLDTKVSPLGTRKLIGSPARIAGWQEPQRVDETPVVANALLCCDLIFGSDDALYDEYVKHVQYILDEGESRALTKRRQTRGIELLEKTLEEFSSTVRRSSRGNDRWETVEAFGIKAELYRPIQELIAALSLMCRVQVQSTCGRIQELVKLKILPEKLGEELLAALRVVYDLRLQAHYLCEDECDLIHLPVRGKQSLEEKVGRKAFVASEEDRKAILLVYECLRRFQGSVEAGIENTWDMALNLIAKLLERKYSDERLLKPSSKLRAYDYLRMGAFNEAIQIYEEKAGEGVAGAQFNLGLLYYNAHGRDRDVNEAARLFLLAAKGGCEHAMYQLGSCSVNGEGVERNLEEAIEWWKQAAKGGSVDASFVLGEVYFNGKGVEKDLLLAVKYWTEAAEKGDEAARANLADCYFNGWGVETDRTEAMRLWELSAKQGDTGAQYRIAEAYLLGDVKGYEQSFKLAVKYLKLAARQRYARAQYKLALCYTNGDGVLQDKKEAARLLALAADQWHAEALFMLAAWTQAGVGVPKDLGRAVELYENAVALKHPQAQNNLAALYAQGLGVKKDEVKAFELFCDAAKGGLKNGKLNVAKCYFDGRGVDKDGERAFDLFNELAGEEDPEAQYYVGLCYADGIGMALPWPQMAVVYLAKAAKGGHGMAQCDLGWRHKVGDGVKKDIKAAIYWTNEAYGNGIPGARFNLAVWLYLGIGMEASEELAFQLLDDFPQLPSLVEAIKQNAARQAGWGYFNLGFCYQLGVGVEKDLSKAKEYYQLAADQGNGDAKIALGGLKA